jgi:hypothetical protein
MAQTDTSGFQQAKDQARDLAQDAKAQAKSLAGDAKAQAKEVAGQTRDHVQTLVGQQKDQMAERLGSLAGALREAGRKLNEGQQAGDFGQYTDRAAGQVERLSSYLRDTDLRGFVRDAETFARRRPEVFLGGTLVAGLMLARFLKASGQGEGGYDGRDRSGAWTGDRASAGGSFQGQSASRSSYTPQRGSASTGESSVANAGTPPYNAPVGV